MPKTKAVGFIRELRELLKKYDATIEVDECGCIYLDDEETSRYIGTSIDVLACTLSEAHWTMSKER